MKLQKLSLVGCLTTLISLHPNLHWMQTQQTDQAIAQEAQDNAFQAGSINGQLDSNSKQVEGGRYYNVHSFRGEAGDTITLNLESSEFNPYLVLYDRKVNKIGEDNDGGAGDDARLKVTLPKTGPYLMIVLSASKKTTGNYTLSWQKASENDDHQAKADQLMSQGVKQLSDNKFKASIALFEQALDLFKKIGSREGQTDALRALGLVYFKSFKYPQAIEAHQKLLTIHRETRNRKEAAASLYFLGVAFSSLGQFPKALEMHQQAFAIRKETGDKTGEAISLTNIGITYSSLGQYKKGVQSFNQAQLISKKLGDQGLEAANLNNLGIAYTTLGQYPQAITALQESLALNRKLKDRSGEGKALGSLGSVYQAIGQYQQAIKAHQQSLAIDREVGDRGAEAKSLGNLGIAYRLVGQYQKAIKIHQQSLDLYRDLGDREGEAAALGDLGQSYWNLQKYQQAIEFYQQDVAISKEIGARSNAADALGNLGFIYTDLRQYKQALTYHQQSLAIEQDIGDRQGEGLALYGIGQVLFITGKLPQAEAKLTAAVEVIESLRPGLADKNKISIFDKQVPFYTLLQRTLVAQGKTTHALEISERGRARAFVELLASRSSQPRTTPVNLQPPSITDIQRIAKEQNATLVEYSILEDDLYIWVVSPTGTVTSKQVEFKAANQQLRNLVIETRDSIGVRGSIALVPGADASAKKQLQTLHQALIAPIEDLLPTAPDAPVIFVPQRELFLVPFPALQAADGSYLLDRHTILTVPAIQVLDLTHQQKTQLTSSKKALLVGNPTMPKVPPEVGAQPQKLPALPGAEREVNAIAATLKATALTGSQATEATVIRKMPSAHLIHLATHGLLDESQGLGSAIALAPSDADDGLLTAEEILTLDLRADLVVLSACNTGRGKITGDGVIGLSRSFITAGVPSVLVSLWAVPDAPTAELMTIFYDQKGQGLNKAQALRQAMLKTKEKHPNPRDWAAFTLIGESQ